MELKIVVQLNKVCHCLFRIPIALANVNKLNLITVYYQFFMLSLLFSLHTYINSHTLSCEENGKQAINRCLFIPTSIYFYILMKILNKSLIFNLHLDGPEIDHLSPLHCSSRMGTHTYKHILKSFPV